MLNLTAENGTNQGPHAFVYTTNMLKQLKLHHNNVKPHFLHNKQEKVTL